MEPGRTGVRLMVQHDLQARKLKAEAELMQMKVQAVGAVKGMTVKGAPYSGEEINATRKASNVGLADLFPIFPPGDVKPGSSWTTTMTFISELSTRTPINLRDVPNDARLLFRSGG